VSTQTGKIQRFFWLWRGVDRLTERRRFSICSAEDDSHEILLPFTWCSVFLSPTSLENTIVAMRGRENGYHVVKQQANSRQSTFPKQTNLLDTDVCSGSDSLASSIKLDFFIAPNSRMDLSMICPTVQRRLRQTSIVFFTAYPPSRLLKSPF
jgi:hypothetical protein